MLATIHHHNSLIDKVEYTVAGIDEAVTLPVPSTGGYLIVDHDEGFNHFVTKNDSWKEHITILMSKSGTYTRKGK